MCAYASHGDTKHILLFPANPHECFEFAAQSFDLAERFQTPVFMLSDLDIGMNDWVVPKLIWDDEYVPDRGRVLDDKELAEVAEFFRYTNEDEEFVTPRTLPGSNSKARTSSAARARQVRSIHRDSRSVPRGHRPTEAEARRRRSPRAVAHHRTAGRGQGGRDHDRQL